MAKEAAARTAVESSSPTTKPQPLAFRHNFMHKDVEAEEKGQAPVAAMTGTKDDKGKHIVAKKKKRKPVFIDGVEQPIELTAEEIEIEKARANLPSFLQDPPKKYNNIARTQFESQLIFDLALSCGIPEKYFSIEEVRNLPKDDPKVAGFIERNQVIHDMVCRLTTALTPALTTPFGFACLSDHIRPRGRPASS